MRRVIRSRRRRRVVATLRDGQTFSGVLVDHDSEALVLAEATASAAGPGGRDVPADGQVVLYVEQVAYLQFP